MTFRNVDYKGLLLKYYYLIILLMRADIRVNIRADIRVSLIKRVTY